MKKISQDNPENTQPTREELIRDLEELQKIENYMEENRILFYEPHQKQKIFHDSEAPYRLLHGANRSGKTVSGAAEAVWYALGIHPTKKVNVPNEGWVVSETYKVQEEASQKLIMHFLPKDSIKSINRIKGGIYDSIVLTNGSKISFKSSDSGVRNFAGAAKRWIWFDEEPPKDIYNECVARIGAGEKLDIWLTMTPIFEDRGSGRKIGMSWTYRDLYLKRDTTRIFCIGIGIADNTYLTKEQIEEQKRKYHGAEYRIRIEGAFELLSGSLVFDAEAIKEYLEISGDPLKRGFLTSSGSPSLSPDEKGNLLIWQEPRGDHRHFIGADIGLGVGGDPSCAMVFNHRLELVAELHGQIPPDMMAEQLIKLGNYYNRAWIGVEANSFGIACIDGMKKKYPKMYYQYKVDQRSDIKTRRIGWWTDKKTKPLMINDFGHALRERSIKLPSRQLIEELTTYVIGEAGDCNAEIGCHDDRVIAAMIALQVRKRFLNHGLNQPAQDYRPANQTTGY